MESKKYTQTLRQMLLMIIISSSCLRLLSNLSYTTFTYYYYSDDFQIIKRWFEITTNIYSPTSYQLTVT